MMRYPIITIAGCAASMLAVLVQVAAYSWFVLAHGRLPMGGGELINWLLGLG